MKIKLVEEIFDEPVEEIVAPEIGLTDIIIALINKKWDTVRDLNSLIVNLNDADYSDYVPVVEEILEEENNHIGKLQHVVELLSPSATNIDTGKQEAEDIIEGE